MYTLIKAYNHTPVFISVYVLGLFLFLSQKGKLPADVTTEEDILEKYYMYAAMATCLQNGQLQILVIRYCWFDKVFQRCHKGLEFTIGPPLKTFIFSLQTHIVVSCFSMVRVRVNLNKSPFQIAFLSQKTSKWSIFTIGQILKSLLCMRNIHNS